MPVSTNKNVVCKNCGNTIKVVRVGDVLGPKDAKLLFDSYCRKCKIKKLIGLSNS